MKIDRVHFYVENASLWREWFVGQLGFQALEGNTSSHTRTEVVKSGSVCFVLSSPVTSASPVAEYLRLHPPGVADVAFLVDDIESAISKAVREGVKILQPIQVEQRGKQRFKSAKIAAWGSLSHTLIEAGELLSRGAGEHFLLPTTNYPVTFTCIDHVVLNVNAGELESAINWYENILGFRRQQKFNIQTDRSGLSSQVMLHPSNWVQFPINEPASANSQIQEFLDINGGPGIQHIALQTPNILAAIARLRASGVPFIQVPSTYYTELQKRQQLPLSATELAEIAEKEILVDCDEGISQAGEEPSPLLLQTFTKPIFEQPTFFFEVIERRACYINGEQKRAQGFGEGNFRALFEAIELEQMTRGSMGVREKEKTYPFDQ